MIVFRPAAKRDVRSITAWFAERSLSIDLSRRFLSAVKMDCVTLERFPQLDRVRLDGPPHGSVRRLPVTGFPKYIILYSPIEEGIAIERVLHSAQDVSLGFE